MDLMYSVRHSLMPFGGLYPKINFIYASEYDFEVLIKKIRTRNKDKKISVVNLIGNDSFLFNENFDYYIVLGNHMGFLKQRKMKTKLKEMLKNKKYIIFISKNIDYEVFGQKFCSDYVKFYHFLNNELINERKGVINL